VRLYEPATRQIMSASLARARQGSRSHVPRTGSAWSVSRDLFGIEFVGSPIHAWLDQGAAPAHPLANRAPGQRYRPILSRADARVCTRSVGR